MRYRLSVHGKHAPKLRYPARAPKKFVYEKIRNDHTFLFQFLVLVEGTDGFRFFGEQVLEFLRISLCFSGRANDDVIDSWLGFSVRVKEKQTNTKCDRRVAGVFAKPAGVSEHIGN